jgi:hypothetical protein
MIEHWIRRDLSRFRRALFFAALFADFVPRALKTLDRHPEEPRPSAASRRMAAGAGACGHPSRVAVKNGEHLRMTMEIFSFINIKFFES